jgi:hypothetical protein
MASGHRSVEEGQHFHTTVSVMADPTISFHFKVSSWDMHENGYKMGGNSVAWGILVSEIIKMQTAFREGSLVSA